ncbi:MAG: hypothetical protein EXQ83_02155 [Xanthobacteraceae bacterium]|nr:hypothetical protein [Xanthobacteraceae bacterium]
MAGQNSKLYPDTLTKARTAGTPPELTKKISDAVGEVMKQPEVSGKLTTMSMVSTGSTSAEFSKFINEEAKRWGDVIRTTGAKAQ